MYRRSVIGVDPGLMTGVFAWHYVERQPGFPASDEPSYGTDAQHVRAEDVPAVLHRMLRVEYADLNPAIAVEQFIINARTAKASQQTEALEVTGMVKAVAALLNVEVRQYLKANIPFASDEALRTAGWRAANMRHANDAARQAFALLKDLDYPLWTRVYRGEYDVNR